MLKEKRPEPVSKADIKAAKGFNVSELPELLEQLQQHSNIEQTPSGGYVFKVIPLALIQPRRLIGWTNLHYTIPPSFLSFTP